MKVIVAGAPKTGTKSLNEALTLLGYEVYDFLENFYYLGDDWVKQIRDGVKVEDFRRMFENVDVVIDVPCDFYWEELFEAFPDAKVILTTRNENDWHRSLVNQFDNMNNDMFVTLTQVFSYTGWKIHRFRKYTAQHLGYLNRWPGTHFTVFGEEHLKRQYRKHNERVKQKIPQKQLLVYQVTEGWGPLCKFLGVPTPPTPFPHKNIKASVVSDMRKEHVIMKKIERDLKLSLAFWAGVASVFVFIFIRWYF